MDQSLVQRLLAFLLVLAVSLGIWFVASIFGVLLKKTLEGLGVWDAPKRLFAAARRMNPGATALALYVTDVNLSVEALREGQSVQVAMDLRHNRLKAALRSAELAIKRVSTGVTGLAGVTGPAEIGRRIGELDERCREAAESSVDLDYKPELAYAQRAVWNFAFFTVLAITAACSLVNGAMLSSFLREVFPVRILGVSGAIPLAVLLVILEVGAGLVFGLSQHVKNVGVRVAIIVVAVVIASALASGEMFIFGIMSSNFDLSTPLIDQSPDLKMWMAPLGLAFVLLTTTLGFLLDFTFERRAAVISGFSLARDLKRAKGFVDGLPERWQVISSKAREAEGAIDEFVSALGAQGSAVSGTVQEIRSERDALIKALRDARVDDWAKLVEGGVGDVRAAAMQNVGIAILSLGAAVGYGLLVTVFARLALGSTVPGSLAVAIGVATVFALYALGHIASDKLELVEAARGRKASLYPLRPHALVIVVAVIFALALAAASAWLGVRLWGIGGVVPGLLVFALGSALVVAGHFAERCIRGMALLVSLSGRTAVALVQLTWGVLLYLGAWVATGLTGLIALVIAIAAAPLECIILLFRRPSTSTPAILDRQAA